MGGDLFFVVSRWCHIVQGCTHDAVYDLSSRKVYRVSKSIGDLLRCCSTGKPIGEACASAKCLYNEGLRALQQFSDLDVGNFTDVVPQTGRDLSSMSKVLPKKILCIEVTRNCNLDCTFCPKGSWAVTRCIGCRRWPNRDASGRPLTVDEWQTVIVDAVAQEFRELEVRGGEPLQEVKLVSEVFRLARESGMEQLVLTTNGTLLYPSVSDQLHDLKVRLQVQIVSLEPDAYEAMTGYRDTYEQLFKNLEHVAALGMPVSVVIPMCGDYIREKERTIDVLDELFGWPTVLDGVNCSTRKCVEWFGPNDVLHKVPDKAAFAIATQGNLCWQKQVAVTCEGDVLPCANARLERLGNVREVSLSYVLKSETYRRYVGWGKDAIEPCHSCEFRYACPDCRARIRWLTGMLDEKDPRCGYDPTAGEWVEPPCSGVILSR